jgi:mannose-6-phosphate isomerase
VTADRLRAHLLEELLPLWAERGVDRRHGGFHNRLRADLSPAPDVHKRLLVQARQLYAFSAALQLGAGSWARQAAEAGFEFLTTRFRDAQHGGWYLTTSLDGQPEDRSKDLYGHAFVIFALAHYAGVCGDSGAARLALETWELLAARLADPKDGGFFESATREWQVVEGPRRQNPHMHLLEALLALAELDRDRDLLTAADALVELLEDRLVDRQRGCLRELFGARWQPLESADGRIVEPGHHFEWVWLLHRAGAAGRPRADATARALFDFARRLGVDGDGLVFDQLDCDGAVRRDSKRLWPQTEHLKALAVQGERAALQGALLRCFDAYVDAQHRGWNEQLTRQRRVSSDAMNATSVYHIVLALREAAEALDQWASRSTLRN